MAALACRCLPVACLPHGSCDDVASRKMITGNYLGDPKNRWFSAAAADGCHYFGWNWIIKQRLQRIDSIDLKC